MFTFTKSFFIAGFVLFLVANQAYAQTKNVGLPTGVQQTHNVIEEIIHPIIIKKYSPEYEITKEGLRAGSSEFIVIKYLNSMIAGNYDLAISTWDSISQKKIAEEEQKQGLNLEKRLSTWRKLFNGNKVILMNRIEYDPYVLVEYRIMSQDGKIVAEEAVATKMIGAEHFLTLELAESAVIQGWKQPSKRIQRLSKQLYNSLRKY